MTFMETMRLSPEQQAERHHYPNCGYSREGYRAFHDGVPLDECPENGTGSIREYIWKKGWFIAKQRGIIPLTTDELNERYYRMTFSTGVRVWEHTNPPIPILEYEFVTWDGIKMQTYWIEEEPPQSEPMYLAPFEYEPKPYEHAIRIMGGACVSMWAIFRRTE